MSIVKGARGLGTFPWLAVAVNVVMAVAVGLLFVITETTWSRCLADVHAGLTPLTPCQEQRTHGDAAIAFLLVPTWVLANVALTAAWGRRSAGIRSAPASWTAFGLTVAGLVAMVSLGYFTAVAYLLTAPGVVAGLIAMRRSKRAGFTDPLAMVSVAIGSLGVVMGVGMIMTS